MIYILSMETQGRGPVVIGAYTSPENMSAALAIWRKENTHYTDDHFFYDVKLPDEEAEWSNAQMKAK